jgi:transposase-like protein
VLKFGPGIASNLRKSRPQSNTRWHLDEMVVSLAGKQTYLWRGVDGEGEALDILVQPRRDKAAALRLLRNSFTARALSQRLSSLINCDLTARPFVKLAIRDCMSKACQQPRGELASAGSTTRAKDARLQISQICSALRFRSCGGLQYFQYSTAFDQPSDASTVSNRRASILESGDSCCTINLRHWG